jgi:hypothetical protein
MEVKCFNNKENSSVCNICIVYNLIILDESGSMSSVIGQTVAGCNKTLNSIRMAAIEDEEQRQLVSIYCFDTSNSRYLFYNTPIEDVEDLTIEKYRPNASTPLYDAIGYTVGQLKEKATDSCSIGKVTIITDGYENASKRWDHAFVVELIEGLKQKGWVFSFMGANIDVDQTSHSLGINNFIEFQQTDEGMKEMFECECRSLRAYSKKLSYLRRSKSFRDASEKERFKMLGLLNENYFMEDERVAPNLLYSLSADEIFVFESDINGFHFEREARQAVTSFGAIVGKPEGVQGQSYAIPSIGNIFENLKIAIEKFTEYVLLHPHNKFILSAIGCGNAGYTPQQIAPLFKKAYEFGNVYVPPIFISYVK